MTADSRPPHVLAAVEALLFVAEDTLTVEALVAAISAADELPVAQAWVESALTELRERYDAVAGGVQLVEVAGGWEFRTRAEQAVYVRQLYKRPPVRLSRAALEVLAVVAYRQPCTRADIEDIRGVECSRLLRVLLDRGLVRIIGKADDVGRPLLYGTSPAFLEFFGLASLGELPTLREYTELTEEHVVRLQEFEETLRATDEAGTGAGPGDSPGATDGTPEASAIPSSRDGEARGAAGGDPPPGADEE